MAKDSIDWESLLALGMAGFLGYQTAKERNISPWVQVNTQADSRIALISQANIVKPVEFLRASGANTVHLYQEAVWAFVYGLHNSSVSTSLRCLEIGLRIKYEETNDNKVPTRLIDLIEWAEPYLKSKRDIAHGFRILRNLVHTDTLVEQQDALEALRHVSKLLNVLYPAVVSSITQMCGTCGQTEAYSIWQTSCSLFQYINLTCSSCQQPMSVRVFP